ncbi:carboxypeptidase-like regulatory domain-containing protein [Larkinella rosea]|uniref:Carboxypeptidase-like regulatory domain-containing protein n=1 Tax=Larkinella rosea TaxID=2025312 RepID=A0A3P1BRN8_9BACT|nr:carboxypeptidase-like regulatory domain-containing protein [Larkinella rosea]RRB03765.1 carboxypeptidase-like regulatory domain-containing protein [Larkinella rosea]
MKKTLLFFLVLLSAIGHAQTIRSGSVVDKSNQKPIVSATVQNTSLSRATMSTETGQFRITASPNDTLLISCIGYKTVQLIVPIDEQELIVELIQDVKMLNEVVIKGWTESRFKQEFMKLNIAPKPVIEIKTAPELVGVSLGNVGRMGYDYATLAPKMTLKGPISALYGRFSKEAKNEKKLQQFNQAELNKKRYQARLDPIWISRITELKEERLTAFMQFCKLPEKFVLEANEYDLIVAIRGCLKDFLVQEKG